MIRLLPVLLIAAVLIPSGSLPADPLDTDGDGVPDAEDPCPLDPPLLSPPVRLTDPLDPGERIFTYEVSEDGLWLVYEVGATTSEPTRLYSVPLDGGTPTVLAFAINYREWELSADGNWVVFRFSDDVHAGAVYSVPIQGGLPFELNTAIDQVAGDFAVTPDSTRVVLRGLDLTDGDRLYSIPIGGGPATQLSLELVDDVGEFWISPDSTHVVFVEESGPPFLHSSSIDGASQVLLDGPISGEFKLEIAADSSRVVWVAENLQLKSVPLAGGPVITLGFLRDHPQVDFWSYQGLTPAHVVGPTRALFTDELFDLVSVPVTGGSAVVVDSEPDGDPRNWVYPGFKYSPDGRLVYLWDETRDQLRSSSILGGPATVLNPPSSNCQSPSVGPWVISPDGQAVAYSHEVQSCYLRELFGVPIGGGPSIQLSHPIQPGEEAVRRLTTMNTYGVVVYGTRTRLFTVPFAGGTAREIHLLPVGKQLGFLTVTSSERLVYSQLPDMVNAFLEAVYIVHLLHTDGDSDGSFQACDNCLEEFNPDQDDFDDDGEGDACDLDDGMTILEMRPTSVSWQMEGSPPWSLHRGDLGILKAGGDYAQLPGSNPIAAQVCDLTVGFASDSWFPPIGEPAFYLAAVGDDLGTDSSGATRPNANPCP